MELLHILQTAVNAVFPVVLMTLLGYVLQRIGFLSKEFIRVGSKFSFKVLMPCMLFVNVYNIENFASIRWDVVIYCIVILLVIFVLGLVSAVMTTKIPERRGVILQGTFRSNMAIMGLSLASVLGGAEAVATSSIVSAFTLPAMNILAVIALTIFVKPDDTHKVSVGSILKSIIKNPIIDGILVGMVFLLLRALQIHFFGRVVFALNDQLKWVYTALTNVKAMASPFALMILGAQFDFSASRGMLREIIVGSVWRIILAPALAIGTAVLLSKYTLILNFGVNEYPALIALFGTPAAVSSAIMAGQMHNDQQLGTQLVVWTGLCSIPTMFLLVCIMMAAGLLAV
jgi:predicted permease